MTLQEAGRRFSFPMEMLQWYAENGLLKGNKMEDGTIDYSETELQRVVQFHFLEKAGMDPDALKQFVTLRKKGTSTHTEQVRMLRKYRYQLLDQIDKIQQSLDQLDYLIYKIKNQRK